ncbi:hypothetical protein ASG52_19925 [Methylobacterium sp. Leaf456]|uniref:hypothetical protein n=1 Tax=Methylobacterium sp. Leaf456 TaxID=1736382 RepID=UPI0006FD5B76|nr:hypothetical protein [Methylobacterium sp. Leaf456]KQT59996.1 hypothetical protein ASG52_19925 [Methylobacterium sp. Leaf456]
MAESSPTVSDLYKSKTVTEDDVVRLVKAVLNGATDKAPLTEGYVVDLGAAVQASAFAASVLGDKDSGLATKWSAARTAIVLARVERE